MDKVQLLLDNLLDAIEQCDCVEGIRLTSPSGGDDIQEVECVVCKPWREAVDTARRVPVTPSPSSGEVGSRNANGYPVCFCGHDMVVRHGRPHGDFFGCERYPDCDGIIGMNRSTGKALGFPAPKWVRAIRHELHDEFDKLWKPINTHMAQMSRYSAYDWLAGQLGISKDECHIGLFDSEMCARAIEVVSVKLVEFEEIPEKKQVMRNRLESRARAFRAARKDPPVQQLLTDELPPEDDVPF